MNYDIIIIHPDLGIGGAERLIVDAALALSQRGHSVKILTSHHDKSHCFEETINGTIPVEVYGDWLPRSIFGKCKALMAYLRMVYISLYFLLCKCYKPDIVIIDVISVIVPIIQLKCPQVIFYCHFPDQLLSQPGGSLKKLYRMPIDWLEEITIKMATIVFVNSNFTAEVFKSTFKSISKEPSVLYPSLPTEKFDQIRDVEISSELDEIFRDKKFLFLSLNRYERKKNVALAVNALKHLETIVSADLWTKCFLIIAGGYDPLNEENIEHFEELKQLISELHLSEKVLMLKSPNDSVKIQLMKKSTCLIYTPSFEHFGIVPIETMYISRPVLAVNNGGPKETVIDGKTGFLCYPDPVAFALAMKKLVERPELAEQMGAEGHKRIKSEFSFQRFGDQLHSAVSSLSRDIRR